MATPVDPQAIGQAIEILKQAKPLFESTHAYILPAIGILGAIGGALAAFFPSFWNARLQERQLKHSVAVQLYAEIQATLRVERHRGYIAGLRNIVALFDRGEISSSSYKVEVADERFPIYKANIQHLGKLEPRLQQKIVFLYQLVEAAIQDMKPGGLLNATEVGREPFAELLEILLNARAIGDEILAQIEADYPSVR
jgi:hypothetical protein